MNINNSLVTTTIRIRHGSKIFCQRNDFKFRDVFEAGVEALRKKYSLTK